MRTLKFNVDGQNLKKSPDCNFDNIVKGTKAFLKLSFSFSPEWKGCAIVVTFWNYDNELCAVPVVNGLCSVPDEVTDYRKIKISLTGKKKGYKIITNKCIIRQEG